MAANLDPLVGLSSDAEAPVPAEIYDALVLAYTRLDAECATAHQQVKYVRARLRAAQEGYGRQGRLISHWYRQFVRASAVAGIMALVAIVGWLR
jgi:hypothetical protein